MRVHSAVWRHKGTHQRGLNHPGYAFLSFYRVLEVALPEGRRRGEWINDQLDTLSDRKAREAISELNRRQSQHQIGFKRHSASRTSAAWSMHRF
jgi:hypothetical protein